MRCSAPSLEVILVMGGIRIGRIAGFPVSVNWCVLVILWLFTWSLASTLPAAVPD